MPPTPTIWIRARAYDLLCVSDDLAGWQRGRAEFRADRRRTAQALRREADARIRDILRHAYRSTAHYRSSWASFNPEASDLRKELERIPFLTKQVIRERKAALILSDYSESDLMASLTGGTTGAQTPFFLDKACAVRRVGRQWGALELCGYWPGMRRGLMWGVHSDYTGHDGSRSLRRRFRTFAAGDEVMNCTVIHAEGMREYHARLVRFRPQVLYGYPSALEQFAQFIADEGLEPIRVETVITTAERLTESARETLQRAFDSQVFNLYCTREYGCVGHECRLHDGLHVDTGSVYVEIIAGERPVSDGEVGEITVTDLLNRGMPFIRSRTGDLGSLSEEPCACGSPFPRLTSLRGRETDAVRLPDGSVLAGMMLTDLFVDMPGVRLMQFVQESIDELKVRMVTTAEFTGTVEQAAIAEMRTLVGPQMRITINRVEEIPRSRNSGKFQEVISLVSRARVANE